MSRKREKYGSKFVKFNLAQTPLALAQNDHNNVM